MLRKLLLAGIMGSIPCEALPTTAWAQETRDTIVGDAMPSPLTGRPGNAERGRQIALGRDRGNCVICHVIPSSEEATHGDVGPNLNGIADRLTEAQIRLRVVDQRRVNPKSIMPSYYRLEGLNLVAKAYAGKPVLTAQEVEDVVAFLRTLVVCPSQSKGCT